MKWLFFFMFICSVCGLDFKILKKREDYKGIHKEGKCPYINCTAKLFFPISTELVTHSDMLLVYPNPNWVDIDNPRYWIDDNGIEHKKEEVCTHRESYKCENKHEWTEKVTYKC